MKLMKLLASQLPETKRLAIVGEAVQGVDIPEDEFEKSGIKGDPEKYYKKKVPKFQNVNHFKSLKKWYNRNGTKGVIEYVQWVDSNNKRLNKLADNLELERVNKKLMNVINKGVAKFWSNLIMFLMAFLQAFGSKDEEI